MPSRPAVFGMGNAALFCLLALLGTGLTIYTGEYTFGLLLLSAAAGFVALPVYCGKEKLLLAAVTLLPAAALSIFAFPTRYWFTWFVLSFFVLGGTIGFCAKRGWSRTKWTAAGAGALAVWLLAGFLLYLGIRFGGIGESAFTAFREWLTQDLTKQVLYSFAAYRNSLSAIGSSSALELLGSLPTDAAAAETVADMVEVFWSLLPGFFLALCCCLAHLAGSIFLRIGRHYGEYILTKEEKSICIALPGAILFYAGALLTVFGADGAIGLTGMNFFLLYLPGFVLMGGKEVFSKEKRGRRGGLLLPLLLVASVLINPMLLPLLLALFGASRSVKTAMQRKNSEKGK